MLHISDGNGAYELLYRKAWIKKDWVTILNGYKFTITKYQFTWENSYPSALSKKLL